MINDTALGELTIGTFNIEHFGYRVGDGHRGLAAALDWMLRQTPRLPDVLALPEATRGLDDGQRAIWSVVNRLSPALDTGWYTPFFSSRPVIGRRNHLYLLLVNSAKVRPGAWFDPGRVDPVTRYDGFVQCDIFGHQVNICCEHWEGGLGREEFERAAHRVGCWGVRKTLLVGDFNADSGWEGERHHREMDWYGQCVRQGNLHKLFQKGYLDPATGTWQIDTRQLDLLRGMYGFVDVGEAYGDATVTTNPRVGSGLRIDRIFHSRPLPLKVLDYRVFQPPREISDHGYVHARCSVPVMGSDSEGPRPDLD